MKLSMKTIASTLFLTGLAVGATSVLAQQNQVSNSSATPSIVKETPLTHDEAIKAALAAMPGNIIKTELDRDDGVLVWEVELVNNENQHYEFEIDAYTGKILETERDWF